MPRTLADTLPEQVFLLACDPDGRSTLSREVATVVRGALLVELSLRRCLYEEDGTVRVSGTRRTGNAVLDDALRQMSEDRPQAWRGWTRRNTGQTMSAIRNQLSTHGVITVEPGRVLGIFPVTRIVVRDAAQVRTLRDTVQSVVRGEQPVSDEQAALVALVSCGELRSTLSRKDRRTYTERLKSLTEQATAAVPALGPVLRQIRASRAAARGGGG